MATAIEKCKAAEEVVQNLDGMKFDSPPKKGVIARWDRIPNFYRKHTIVQVLYYNGCLNTGITRAILAHRLPWLH